MRVFRSLEEVPGDFGPSALTIGNFDGVHFGHRQILRRLKELAGAHRWTPSVLMFHPHPTRVVAPERAPRLMTSPDQRAELMREEGIEQVLILPFDRGVAHLSPEEFVQGLLVARLGVRAVLVGDNFRFGYKQAGNIEVLRELGKRLDFETETVPVIRCRGQIVSSSEIRGLLQEGRVATAARHLQRPYTLAGEVVSGRGVGSKQTVPTLNLATAAEVIPKSGVYVTRTRETGSKREWQSITNVGYRPTFGESDQLSIETFLLTPLEGDTPQGISVEFLWRVREERKFDSPEALKMQILRDVGAALRYFRRVQNWTARPMAQA